MAEPHSYSMTLDLDVQDPSRVLEAAAGKLVPPLTLTEDPGAARQAAA